MAAGLGMLVAMFWPPVQQSLLRPPFFTALDRQAETVVDAGLKRALTTFALARGLNAVISAAQGTEVQRATDLVEHVLKLILVFVLDTILLPLAFLWGVWRLVRGLLGGRAAQRVEDFWRQRLTR